LDQLFSSDDYPPGYALNNVEGELVLRLTIGTDGKVKDCVPLNRRADRYFLQNVCGKLKLLARFQPALDQQGQVVPAPFVTAATFAMER
jgi:protein TonB